MKRFKRTYTLEEFEKEVLYLIRESNGYGIHQLFDKEWIGSCPCASGKLKIENNEYTITTHCWRSSATTGNNCSLEVYGRKGKVKEKVTALLLEALNVTDWYGDYELI